MKKSLTYLKPAVLTIILLAPGPRGWVVGWSPTARHQPFSADSHPDRAAFRRRKKRAKRAIADSYLR